MSASVETLLVDWRGLEATCTLMVRETSQGSPLTLRGSAVSVTIVQAADIDALLLMQFDNQAASNSTIPAPGHCVAQQRDWFYQGNNGCVFARIAAARANSIGWRYFVVEVEKDAVPSTDQLVEVDALVSAAIVEPSCNICSIVFPAITTTEQALATIERLVSGTTFTVECETVFADHLAIAVRRPVTSDCMAWVMAFGPFSTMPATRRAPYFELTLRTKPKPLELYHRLNDDPAAAHLADIPLTMPAVHWDHRWVSTQRRTRSILNGEPDVLSAARTTFVVPVAQVLKSH